MWAVGIWAVRHVFPLWINGSAEGRGFWRPSRADWLDRFILESVLFATDLMRTERILEILLLF